MSTLSFLGGAGTVTGSSFLLETGDVKLLVDCGLFQGGREIRERNWRPFAFSPADIDYVVLTHAHIDHSGLLPRLCREGFRGRIIATRASVDLARIMLPDSAHIQESEAEWRNRKRERAGLPLEPPLYTVADAEAVLPHFLGVNYDEIISLTSTVKIRLRDAGHILGSAILEVWVSNTEDFKIVFSGDLGNSGQPLIRDPALIEAADYLVLEATYGSRLHPPREERRPELARIIRETTSRGGNVVIPAFAIERTQDLLYDLSSLFASGEIPVQVPVFVDSPLATKATEVFIRHPGYYDQETWQVLSQGREPLSFPNLKFVRTAEESKALNATAKGSIIISASGMCDAGRIKHHLKHNLWRPEAGIVLVGYQAEGTLGRQLLEGAKKVRIFGEEVAVKARVFNLSAYSAHADQAGLVRWVSAFEQKPQVVFLVHGEEEALGTLANLLRERLDLAVHVPAWGEKVELTGGALQVTCSGNCGQAPGSVVAVVSRLRQELARLEANRDAVSDPTVARELERLASEIAELNQRFPLTFAPEARIMNS